MKMPGDYFFESKMFSEHKYRVVYWDTNTGLYKLERFATFAEGDMRCAELVMQGITVTISATYKGWQNPKGFTCGVDRGDGKTK